jgi:hypothetical protein
MMIGIAGTMPVRGLAGDDPQADPADARPRLLSGCASGFVTAGRREDRGVRDETGTDRAARRADRIDARGGGRGRAEEESDEQARGRRRLQRRL